jgi:putative NADPH-quinone reductase
MTAPDILVLYAHPAPQRSPLSRRLAETARAVPGVALQDLYELYPDFDIDADRERSLLQAAHLVVLLHPIRWYGMPSMLKEWMDVVLRPGPGLGTDAGADTGVDTGAGTDGANGTAAAAPALRDKACWLVTSTGSGPEAWGPGGIHGHPFDAFLLPIRQAALLCGMDWLAPLVMHGTLDAGAAALDAHVHEFGRRLAGYAGQAPMPEVRHGA